MKTFFPSEEEVRAATHLADVCETDDGYVTLRLFPEQCFALVLTTTAPYRKITAVRVSPKTATHLIADVHNDT